MKVWIDTASGTWGEVDGDSGRLMIVDLEAQAAEDVRGGFNPSHDATSLLAFLDGASDSEIAAYGDECGRLAQ